MCVCVEQDVHKALLEYLDDEDIPVEYGGKSEKHLYETEPEKRLRQQVKKVTNNQEHPR